MSRKYFGTDGVRGRVGETPITPEFVMRLGYAAGRILVENERRARNERSSVIIGKDTRISGYMLEMRVSLPMITEERSLRARRSFSTRMRPAA